MTGLDTTRTSGARAGIDLGGTKIEGVLLGPDGCERARQRIAAPHGSYGETIETIAQLLGALEQAGQCTSTPLGLAIPGSLSRRTGLVHNANSTWLNGRPLDRDLSQRLNRNVAIANDANCFALSEATDGAGQGHQSVFGVILGTGCGGALIHKVDSSMDLSASPANGGTIPCRGQSWTNFQGPNAGADGAAAWRRGFPARHWRLILRA